MKFSITDFFSICDQIRTFTEEIRNGKHFLCSVWFLHESFVLRLSQALQLIKPKSKNKQEKIYLGNRNEFFRFYSEYKKHVH